MTTKEKLFGVLVVILHRIRKHPTELMVLMLGILILVQQQRIILAVEKGAYYEPNTLDVRVINTPSVEVTNLR